jgi:hypothetical protein
MPEEIERQQSGQEKPEGLIAAIVDRGYLGGELQAFFRQGIGEIGTALKAFPDAIMHDEPGVAFSPLYRDMPGDPPEHTAGMHKAELPTPSQIAREIAPVQTEQDHSQEQTQERGGRSM